MEWDVKGSKRQAYGFRYDNNNRLIKATHGTEAPGRPCDYVAANHYTVPYISYDPLGNIKVLSRYGLVDPEAQEPEYELIDVLSYDYTGSSLLTNVTDHADVLERGFKAEASAYGYDNNGNLKTDSGKGITNIAYSYNDLPLEIETTEGKVTNWYTADGMKIRSYSTASESPGGSGPEPLETVYIGAAELKNDKLHAYYFDDGRVVYDEKDGPYQEFYLKDHLGNTRARIADKNGDKKVTIDLNDPENDELMDAVHYYPFGMQWDTPKFDFNDNSLEQTGAKTKYTYNGKEFQDDLGINMHYYGARMYDAAIARFTSVDPIAEKFAPLSAFNYANNDPIKNIDLHGLQGIGNWVLRQEAGEVERYIESKLDVSIETTGVSKPIPHKAYTPKEVAQGMKDFGGEVEMAGLTVATVAPPIGGWIAGVGAAIDGTGTLYMIALELDGDGELSNETIVELAVDGASELLPKPFEMAIDEMKIDNAAKDLLKSQVKLFTEGVNNLAKETINEQNACQQECTE